MLEKPRILFLVFWALGLSAHPGFSQDGFPVSEEPTSNEIIQPGSLPPETASPQTVLDPDSLAQKSVLDSVPLAKKVFNHKEQIITGGVIMGCLALIMASMNNYNPR